MKKERKGMSYYITDTLHTTIILYLALLLIGFFSIYTMCELINLNSIL